MKIPFEESKFLSQWNKYEVARYVPSLTRVIRDKVNGNPLFLESDSIKDYSNKNNNSGIYTSVFAYNTEDLEKATRLGPLYFDIDSDNIESAYQDAKNFTKN